VKEEVKELTIEVHQLQKAATSRRGPEGGRGPQGIPGIQGPKGDTGTVSKEQAIALFREVFNELFRDEVGKRFVAEVIKAITDDIRRRLKVEIVKAAA
jgi:hypothetical protein